MKNLLLLLTVLFTQHACVNTSNSVTPKVKNNKDSNYLELLYKGKAVMFNKKPQLAIDNYFNPLISICQKKDNTITENTCAETLYHKGYAYLELNKVTDARVWIKKAIVVLPKKSAYISELAFTYQHEKKWEEALTLFKKAENLALKYPNFKDNTSRGLGRSIRGQGFSLTEQGKLSESKDAYMRALKVNKNDKKALYELKYIQTLKMK